MECCVHLSSPPAPNLRSQIKVKFACLNHCYGLLYNHLSTGVYCTLVLIMCWKITITSHFFLYAYHPIYFICLFLLYLFYRESLCWFIHEIIPNWTHLQFYFQSMFLKHIWSSTCCCFRHKLANGKTRRIMSREEFRLLHYAGEVNYNVNGKLPSSASVI